MKYIKSTTQKSYVVIGKVIPPCVTPRNQTLALNDSEWFQVSSQPVIAALIKSGDLLVLDEDPNVKEDIGARNQVAELMAKNQQLEDQIRQLTEASSDSQDDWKQKYDQLKTEALKEIADLKQQLADNDAENDELTAAAEEEDE